MHRNEEWRMRAAMRRGEIRDPLYYSCNPSESGAQKTDGGLLRREREQRERMVKGLGCTGVNTFLSCQLELAWQQRCDGFDGMIGTHRPGPMNDLDELHMRNFEPRCPDSMRRSCPSIEAKRAIQRPFVASGMVELSMGPAEYPVDNWLKLNPSACKHIQRHHSEVLPTPLSAR